MSHGETLKLPEGFQDQAWFAKDPDLWTGLSMSMEAYHEAFPCTCGDDDHPCLCGP